MAERDGLGKVELMVRLPGVRGSPEPSGLFVGEGGRIKPLARPVLEFNLGKVPVPIDDTGRDEGRLTLVGLCRPKTLDLFPATVGEGGILDKLSTVRSDKDGLGGRLVVCTGDTTTLSDNSVEASLSSGLSVM